MAHKYETLRDDFFKKQEGREVRDKLLFKGSPIRKEDGEYIGIVSIF